MFFSTSIRSIDVAQNHCPVFPCIIMYGCNYTISIELSIDITSTQPIIDWKAWRLSVTGATSGVGLCE